MKYKLMHVTRSRTLISKTYQTDYRVLEIVYRYRYLGFVVSSDPSWANHIDKTVAEASRVLGLITRISGVSQSHSH